MANFLLEEEFNMPKYNNLIQNLEKPEKKICIYGLLDPHTKEIKYIGQTIQGIKRIKEHYHKSHKRNKITNLLSRSKLWIYNLKKQNKIFEVIYLEYFEDEIFLDEAEIFWINYFKFLGCQLLNHLDGGYINTKKDKKLISQKTKEAMNNPIIKQKCRENIQKQRELGIIKPRKLSEYSKNKISLAQNHNVQIIQDEDGNIFRGLHQAAKYYNVTFGAIWKVLNGYCKTVKGKKLTLLKRGV